MKELVERFETGESFTEGDQAQAGGFGECGEVGIGLAVG